MGLTALLGVAAVVGLVSVIKQDLQPRHGVILVTVAWVSLPLCGALPIWAVMFGSWAHQSRSPMPILKPSPD